MRSALAIAVLLAACNPSPSSPTVPLRDDDLVELERIRGLWAKHGMPDPGDCGRDAEIVWPASDADVVRWCRCPTNERCADACLTSYRPGWGPFGGRVPLLVVSASQPRGSWRHEALHLLQRCAGLPRVHDEAFKRVLADVEANE